MAQWKTCRIHKRRNPLHPSLPFHSPTGDLKFHCHIFRTLCVGPWILQGSYCPSPLQAQIHTHLNRSFKKVDPDKTLIILMTYVPSPFTWLSNYHTGGLNIFHQHQTPPPDMFFPNLITYAVVFCNHCCCSAATVGQMEGYLTTFQTIGQIFHRLLTGLNHMQV